MSRFHQLKIKDIKKETADCVSVTFEIPEGSRKDFAYRQGQFLTFRKMINGEEMRRSYSICSSPLDKELSVAIKKVPDGIFSNFVNTEAKIGDTLEVMPPAGRFMNKSAAGKNKCYLAVAAGSGITPVISIIKTILRTEPDSQVHLVYGNKDRQSIIFKEELEALKNKFMNRFGLYFILSREQTHAALFNGRINKEKISYFLQHLLPAPDISESFLCGPEEMILAAKEVLTEQGMPDENIHFELFTAAGAQKNFTRNTEIVVLGEQSNVAVILDGTTMEFSIPYDGNSILDAALRNGASLPYACKGGVCATCRAKLEMGEVHMDVNYGLMQEELEAGFILTCQSHPRSKQLVVNFDTR